MEVIVRQNDVESSIVRLRKLVERDGVLKELRIRAICPSKADRRKLKDATAAKRRRKIEKRRERYG